MSREKIQYGAHVSDLLQLLSLLKEWDPKCSGKKKKSVREQARSMKRYDYSKEII